MLNRPQAHGCFLRVAPEGRLLSSKPQQGASAALDEPFGVTATAADQAGTKVKSRQGVRLPNASESQILRELALRKHHVLILSLAKWPCIPKFVGSFDYM